MVDDDVLVDPCGTRAHKHASSSRFSSLNHSTCNILHIVLTRNIDIILLSYSLTHPNDLFSVASCLSSQHS